MADENTPVKTFNCVARKRMHTRDAEEFTEIAALLDENHVWSLLCDYPCTVYGWEVSAPGGGSYNCSVSEGAGVVEGTLAKTIAAEAVPIADNSGSGSARIDLIELRGRSLSSDPLPQDMTETASDSATEVTLGAITRTAVTGEAVGTGDGSQKAWDLAHSGVDGRTLKVQVAGTAVGGWNLSPGTGTAGVDQIIFGDAPALGDAITADYTWQSGGTETPASHNTRKTRGVTFNVVTGTPGAGAPSWTAGAIKIAQVEVPAFWAGGPSGVTVTNSVKEFMFHADQGADADAPGVAPNAGKVFTPLRRIDQVVHGCRPYYISADVIGITPGWGSIGGVSFRLDTESFYTIPALGGTGWYYVYGIVYASDSAIPGSIITYEVSTEPPTWLRRKSAGTTVRRVYLGAIYATATTPTIRPFYTHGDWVYWQSPTSLSLTIDGSTYDLDVTDWCPETGRLLDVLAFIEGTSNTDGDWLHLDVASHMNGTSQPWPRVRTQTPWAYTGGLDLLQYITGTVRAEDGGGAPNQRWINYTGGINGSIVSPSGEVYVQGYLDDYRTVDNSGSPLFY